MQDAEVPDGAALFTSSYGDIRHSNALAESAVGGLEQPRLETVSLQQLVELGTIALRKPGRLRDVAAGHAQDAHQVVALEPLARLFQGSQRLRLLPQRLL